MKRDEALRQSNAGPATLQEPLASGRSEGLERFILAIEEITEVLYACTECKHFTCDEATLTADSACDAIEAIDAILRHHALIPTEVTHADDCHYAPT